MQGYHAATYGDRIADLYDDLYQEVLDPTDTVELLTALVGDGRALELGIGTGRVAVPLATRGVEVHGIDSSDRMVAQLRSKPGGDQIPVTIGDLADVGVDGSFAVIYIPFATLFALQSQDEQIRCLTNVATHLDGDGRFVLDAFVPDLHRFGPANESITMEDLGTGHVMLGTMRHDGFEQVVEGHHVLITESATRLFPLRIRYCWPSELDVMARLAGLELESRFGDYDRRPFGPESERHVSVYRRAHTA